MASFESSPATSRSILTCPACGYLTIDAKFYGSYKLCPVCDWEDDCIQLCNPGTGGGANSESLVEKQREFFILSANNNVNALSQCVADAHACTGERGENGEKNEREESERERDPNWRMLSEEEVVQVYTVQVLFC